MNRQPSYASVAAGNWGRPSYTASSDSHAPSYGEIQEADTSSTSYPSFPHESRARAPSHNHSHHRHSSSSFTGHGGFDHSLSFDGAIGFAGMHPPTSTYSPYGQTYRHTPGDGLLRPSYLRGSRYMQRLQVQHKAKLAAQRRDAESQMARSASSSSLSLHKLAPSHRGMTYEIVENVPRSSSPGRGDDGRTRREASRDVPPLPSRLMHGELEISDNGLELRWQGAASKPAGENQEYAAVIADHPMPVAAGVYYYEMTVVSKNKDSLIAMGFSDPGVKLHRLPGWEPNSWAWHGDDGKKFNCATTGTQYGMPFGAGDTVGCGVNFHTQTAFFTKNGHYLRDAFRDLSKDIPLIPSVGMRKIPAHVKVNFGQSDFTFDIDGFMELEKGRIRQQIMATKLNSVLSGRSEDMLIKELVAQFLRHGGYVEAARAFSREVKTEQQALGSTERTFADLEEQDVDAVHRQEVRAAILRGDMSTAIKTTVTYYAKCLDLHPTIQFKLRCLQLIEMIGQTTEQSQAAQTSATSSLVKGKSVAGWRTLRHAPSAMDLDEPSPRSDGKSSDSSRQSVTLEETLEYARMLNMDYKDNPRPEIRDGLKRIQGLWAYENPQASREVGYLFTLEERAAVAEEVNGAILESQGRSSVAAIERMAQQTEVLVEEITGQGLPGALINLERDVLQPRR